MIAQEPAPKKMEWNGYTQLRFTTDLDNKNSFTNEAFEVLAEIRS